MLSRADADLVARDRSLPGLALLLDPDVFRDTLRQVMPDVDLEAVAFDYLRYKPGTSCLSAFTLTVGGRPLRGYAKAYRPDDWGKLMKSVRRPGVAGSPVPGRLILTADLIEIVSFPNDNKLMHLGSLLADTGSAVHPLLAKAFPKCPGLQSGTVHCLRYKPERRFVARLDSEGEPRAMLKLYTRPTFDAARNAARALDVMSGLIADSTRYGLLALAWQPGAQLANSIRGPKPSLDPVERVGATLAEFHSRDIGGLRVRDRKAEIATIQATLAGLHATHPPVAQLADELGRILTTELHHTPAVYRPIHGDFYDRQVLIDDDQVVILDLDEAAIGNPAADLGLFIAHLELDACRGKLPEAHVASVRDALLAGYGEPPACVELYTAIGLLQLAPHHFRCREPDWHERTMATLERALTVAMRPELSVV